MKAGTRLHSLVTNAGALALGGIVAQGAFVALEALIARRVGTHAYGIYSSSYVLIMLMVHLMDMGMYWKLVQDGARDPATIKANLGTMMVARLGLFVLAYPLFLGVLWLVADAPEELAFFAMFAFFGVQVGVQELLGAVYTARQKMGLNAVFQAAMPMAILAVTGVLVIPDPTLPRLAIAFIVGAGIVTGLWTWQVWRTEGPKVRISEIGSTLRDCAHYGITGLAWNVYVRIGVLVLTFASTIEEVAFYAVAFKLIDLFFKVAVLANRVIAPRLYADSHHDPDAFARASEILLRLTVAAGAAGALLLYVVGAWLIEFVYGAGFSSSGVLMRILGVSLTLKAIILMAQTIIAAADDHSHRTKVVTAATVLTIALAVPLAIQWGAEGVAYAVVAGDVGLLALLMWRIRTIKSVARIAPIFVIPCAGALACGVAVSYLSAAVIVEAVGSIAVFGAIIGMSGYLAPLLALIRGNSDAPRAA